MNFLVGDTHQLTKRVMHPEGPEVSCLGPSQTFTYVSLHLAAKN